MNRGKLPGCSARAASGHVAAAPAIPLMKSRRLMQPPGNSRYQSAETPAFLMIGVHLSISDLRWMRNASGCAFSEETVSAPAAASRLLTSGSFSAFCRAADSVLLLITGFGVSLGAHMPNQTVISKSGKPDSAAVGKAGSTARRFLVVAGLDQPVLNRLENIKRLITHEVELAAYEVVQRRSGALIGNNGDRHLDRVQEQEAAQMGGGADSGVSVHHLFPVRLHMRDEIIEVPSRKILSGDENHRRFRDHPDRLEVLDRVVTEVAVECGIGRMAKVHHQQRVAIRRGCSDLCRAERAACSGHILHQEYSTQDLAHALTDDAGQCVSGSARSIRHHQGHML